MKLGAIAYLVVGLLIYLGLGEYAVFSWVDPWLYVYMVFWPLVLIFEFIFWAVVIGVPVVLALYLYERFH